MSMMTSWHGNAFHITGRSSVGGIYRWPSQEASNAKLYVFFLHSLNKHIAYDRCSMIMWRHVIVQSKCCIGPLNTSRASHNPSQTQTNMSEIIHPIHTSDYRVILGLRPANERRRFFINDVSHWLGASLESALDYLSSGAENCHKCAHLPHFKTIVTSSHGNDLGITGRLHGKSLVGRNANNSRALRRPGAHMSSLQWCAFINALEQQFIYVSTFTNAIFSFMIWVTTNQRWYRCWFYCRISHHS